jgi:hypothetical protein
MPDGVDPRGLFHHDNLVIQVAEDETLRVRCCGKRLRVAKQCHRFAFLEPPCIIGTDTAVDLDASRRDEPPHLGPRRPT